MFSKLLIMQYIQERLYKIKKGEITNTAEEELRELFNMIDENEFDFESETK